MPEREQEVLQLLAAGQSNHEIAQHLIVGLNAVKTHVKGIYAKLICSGTINEQKPLYILKY